jgi:hypothetical protein
MLANPGASNKFGRAGDVIGRGANRIERQPPIRFDGRGPYTSGLLVPIRRIDAVKLSQQRRPRQFTVPVG